MNFPPSLAIPSSRLVVVSGHESYKLPPQMDPSPCIHVGWRNAEHPHTMLWIISLLLNSSHLGKPSLLKPGAFVFTGYLEQQGPRTQRGCAPSSFQLKKWGPSARTCVQIERKSGSMVADLLFDQRVREAATTFVRRFGRQDELHMTGVLDTLLSIQPRGPEALQRVVMVAEIPTSYLKQTIAEATAAAVDRRQNGILLRDKQTSFFQFIGGLYPQNLFLCVDLGPPEVTNTALSPSATHKIWSESPSHPSVR